MTLENWRLKDLLLVTGIVLLLSSLVYAEIGQQKLIASEGETAVVAKSPEFNVQVKIRTHQVQIGKPSDKIPDIIRSGCTYSRFPCSIVDYVDIL